MPKYTGPVIHIDARAQLPPIKEEVELKRVDELRRLMNAIIEEANGISNVGMTSVYWAYRKELDRLTQTP